PPTNDLALSNPSPSGSSFKSGNTIYYNGNVTGGGSFTLTNTLADTESGAASSTTAALGGAYGGTLYLDGAQSAVDSSSYQLTPGTPPSQGAAPSAAVGPAGGISGTFTYVYVTNDGSGHYVASAPSNQLSLSNAKATITGVPAGA